MSTDFGPLILKPGDLITDHLVRSGGWDDHIMGLALSSVAAGSVAIDCSICAAVGSIPNSSASVFGSGRVGRLRPQ